MRAPFHASLRRRAWPRSVRFRFRGGPAFASYVVYPSLLLLLSPTTPRSRPHRSHGQRRGDPRGALCPATGSKSGYRPSPSHSRVWRTHYRPRSSPRAFRTRAGRSASRITRPSLFAHGEHLGRRKYPLVWPYSQAVMASDRPGSCPAHKRVPRGGSGRSRRRGSIIPPPSRFHYWSSRCLALDCGP